MAPTQPRPRRACYPLFVAEPALTMTHEEYLAFESAADVKHEFIDGVVVAMAGGTISLPELYATPN